VLTAAIAALALAGELAVTAAKDSAGTAPAIKIEISLIFIGFLLK
jgi:hypothetical protein